MTDQLIDLVLATGDHLSSDDLRAVRDLFGLGSIFEVNFLAAGLMNQNWQIRAVSGVYALKRISDVGVDAARRNLRVIVQLAELNHPVCMPVPTVAGDYVLEVGGNAYCLIPWISGGHPRGVELSREQADVLGTSLGRLHEGLNMLGGPDLPPASARPTACVADPQRAREDAERFLSHIRRECLISSFDRATVEFLDHRRVLLEKYEHLRPSSDVSAGPFGWTHGDYQHLNVIWRHEELAAVIDWDRIKVRPFGEEVARSATLLFGHDEGWLDLGRVSAFVAGYRRSVTITDDALLDAIDRLWWKRMCDYWHLEFHYDRGDHSCDHLFLSASRFLTWWTERLDEVREAFTARR
ncbi:MAG: phosphotransferase [Pseudonocardiaceae bacterium]